MSTDEIKELMRAGELGRASDELSRRLADEPDNVELKLIYGTCRRLLGDMAAFIKIDDEVSKSPSAEGNVKWRKYHAFRVAACGAAMLIATGLSAVDVEVRSLYGMAVLYGIAPKYGVAPISWQPVSEDGFTVFAKPSTFTAALYSGSRPVGVVSLKTGKIKKDGTVRLSGFIQKEDGTKLTFRPTSVDGASGRFSASLAVARADSASIDISNGRLSGSWNGCRIATATIGGKINKSATFDFGDMPEKINGYSVVYPTENEPVAMAGARWTCGRPATMKWKKCPPCRDGVCANCGYGSWLVNDSNGKTNVSGLKLTYNARQGTFKGTFKVFTWSPNGAKYTVHVSGVVVDGVGYGKASLKKMGQSWSIVVK